MTDTTAVDERIERAKQRDLHYEMVADDPLVVQIDSENSGRVHTVVPSTLHCSCEDHTYRNTLCYHLCFLLLDDDVPEQIQTELEQALDVEYMELLDKQRAIEEQQMGIELVFEAVAGTQDGSEPDEVEDDFGLMVESITTE
jgi:hypothetical protein